MKSHFLALAALLSATLTNLDAQDRGPSREQAQALVASLRFQQGTIALGDNLATINVPPDMRFLNGADAGTVLFKVVG